MSVPMGFGMKHIVDTLSDNRQSGNNYAQMEAVSYFELENNGGGGIRLIRKGGQSMVWRPPANPV